MPRAPSPPVSPILLTLVVSLCVPAASQAQAPASAPTTLAVKPSIPAPPKVPGPKVAAELPVEVYERRRQRLLDRLGACAALVPATRGTTGAAEPSFHYLTGMRTPGAVLLLSPRQVDRQVLLMPESAADGTPNDIQARARTRSAHALDQVQPLRDHGAEQLVRALRQGRCYAQMQAPGSSAAPVFPQRRLDHYLRGLGGHVQQKWHILEHMRAVKEPAEVQRVEKAAAIVAHAHRIAATLVRTQQSEQAVAALVDQSVAVMPGARVAFTTKIASGEGSAQLAWTPGERVPKDGEAAVVAIGAYYGDYAARAVRTYPISDSFSPEVKALHDVVAGAHKQAISAIRSGVSLARVQKIAELALAQAGYRATGKHRNVAPYVRAHFIGLDVRDVGNPDAPLDAGMVLVLETGLLAKERAGVRVADTVLVTPRGQRVLTTPLPITEAEIRAWRSQRKPSP